MALSGTLKDFALPDIFQLIGMQRKTGVLTLESDRETVSVVFEQGMIVYADSTVRRLDDLLGAVLVRQGKLRPEVLEEALAKQKVSMQRLGYILTNQGYIVRDDLRLALSEQVQQIVFRVFRWRSGRYHFDPQARTDDYDREHVTPVSTDHILMEGIRRVDEWPIIEKRIPSLDFVFKPLVPAKQIQIVEGDEGEGSGGLDSAFASMGKGGGNAASQPSSGVMMKPDEARIYKLLDGGRSVITIMEMTGLSDFDVCRTLFDFIDRKLISPAGQGKQAMSSPAAVTRVEGEQSSVLGFLGVVVVLVLAAIGFVASRNTPFRVPTRPSILDQQAENIDRGLDVARLQRVVAALRVYYLAFGSFPNSLDDLSNASPSLLDAEDLLDSNDLRFGYEYDAGTGRAIVRSSGPWGELSVERESRPEGVPLPAHVR